MIKTGWPPGLMQDDSSELSRWFASRPDARQVVRQFHGVSADAKPITIDPRAEYRARLEAYARAGRTVPNPVSGP